MGILNALNEIPRLDIVIKVHSNENRYPEAKVAAMTKSLPRKQPKIETTTAGQDTTTTIASTSDINNLKPLTNTTLSTNAPTSPPRTVKEHRLRQHGFGQELMAAANDFYIAVQNDQDYLVGAGGKGWTYALGVCPSQDLGCYFEPHHKHRPKTRTEAAHALTIPIPEIQYEINSRLTDKPPTAQSCGVIHVRHSDIVFNYNNNRSQTPILKYIELSEYVQEFYKVAPGIRNIVLLTDDQNVIDDALTNYTTSRGHNIQWYYHQRKRFRGAEGGWENHFPSGNRREEVINILVERAMVMDCSVWVGTKSSFGMFLKYFMKNLKTSIDLNNNVPIKPW